MINPKNPKQIVFPHTISGAILNGKLYKWNDVNSGAKPIGAFGLTTNTFWGGRVNMLGFIKELGFWVCLDKHDPNKQKVLGFYLANPDEVTELGKVIIQGVFPQNEIIYMDIDDLPASVEDMSERRKVEQEAMDIGVLGSNFKHISKASVGTLKSLIDAARYEQKLEIEKDIADKKKTVVVEPVDTATDLIKQAKARRKTASVGA